MAGFNLSNLTGRISQVFSENISFSSAFGKNDQALLELLNSLSNGETILGKVLSSDEDSFQISTNNNVIINAKSEPGVTLTEGATVLFEVNKFSEGKVSLRPLYLNTNSEETAKSALKQAGIPVNDRTLEMTVRNMEYGNPIDRNGIMNSYKDVLAFPDYPVKYIVDLQKMNIPVTQDNLNQYQAYMNMTNIVSDSFSDVSESIMNEISDNIALLESADITLPDIMSNEQIVDAKGIINSIIEYTNSSKINEFGNVSVYEADIIKLTNELKSYNFSFNNTDELIKHENIELNTDDKVLSYNPKSVLNAVFKDIDESLNRQISDIFNDKQPEALPKYKMLLQSPEIKNIIVKAFASDWSIKEEDFDKSSISNLYKKLYENTKELSNNLSAHLKADSQSLSLVNNITNNIDFMEQLNKYIPYVQIPLNDNLNNKSELYVYKNRKNFADPDKEMTAFLHLDMEHIGKTDVMIKLLDNNVTTNFYVADDNVLALIEKNLSFLDRRLSEKGYSLKSNMEISDKRISPIQEMLNNNASHLVLAKSSFDARI